MNRGGGRRVEAGEGALQAVRVAGLTLRGVSTALGCAALAVGIAFRALVGSPASAQGGVADGKAPVAVDLVSAPRSDLARRIVYLEAELFREARSHRVLREHVHRESLGVETRLIDLRFRTQEVADGRSGFAVLGGEVQAVDGSPSLHAGVLGVPSVQGVASGSYLRHDELVVPFSLAPGRYRLSLPIVETVDGWLQVSIESEGEVLPFRAATGEKRDRWMVPSRPGDAWFSRFSLDAEFEVN